LSGSLEFGWSLTNNSSISTVFFAQMQYAAMRRTKGIVGHGDVPAK
jgi:hypothetical protein